MMKKITVLLLIMFLFAFLLTACNQDGPVDDKEGADNTGDTNTDNNIKDDIGDKGDEKPKLEIIMNDASEYEIVYPEGCDKYVLSSAQALCAEFFESAGVTINVVSEAQMSANSNKKIIIGRTWVENQEGSCDAIRYNDYTISVDGSNIIISAGSESALTSALHYFIKSVFSNIAQGADGRILVMEVDKIEKTFNFDYDIPSWKICGTNINNYKIIYTEKWGEDIARQLGDAIKNKCGYALEVALDTDSLPTEYEILLSDTNRAESANVTTPAPLHYVAEVSGGKLIVKSGGDHSFPKSLLPIIENISSDKSDVVMNDGYQLNGNLYDDNCDSSKPENSDLRIMSCNILAEFESWSGNPSVEMPYLPVSLRKEIFFAALDYYQPTVIGFQEMTPNWYMAAEEYDTEDVFEILKYANPNRHDGEYVFSTVMYRKDLYTLIDSGMKFYSKFINGRSGCYTWAVLKDNKSGKEFCFISTHWDGTGRPNGFLQQEELSEFVKEMKKNYPVFSTGDFNSNEISPEFIKYLEECEMVDAKHAAEIQVNNVGSWHNFLQQNLSWGSCDHITATNDAVILKFQTLYKNELIYCSDHCWLIADVKFI